MKVSLIVLLVVAGVFIVSFVGLGIYAMVRLQHRGNIKTDERLISSLDSFEKASFAYRILSDYWDKYETQRGRKLALKRMLETVHSLEDWKEIYELTSGWDQGEHEKAKNKLQQLSILD